MSGFPQKPNIPPIGRLIHELKDGLVLKLPDSTHKMSDGNESSGSSSSSGSGVTRYFHFLHTQLGFSAYTTGFFKLGIEDFFPILKLKKSTLIPGRPF